MTTNRFKRSGAKPAAVQAPRARRFAGVQAAGDRDPMPYPGEYVFEVLDCEEGFNPGKQQGSFKVALRVAEIFNGGKDEPGTGSTHKVDDELSAIMMLTSPGMAEFKRFCMATADYSIEDEQAYNEWDPQGEYIEACLGEDNKFSRDEQGQPIGKPCVGQFVGCVVTYTKPDGRGSYYRRYAWFPLTDDENEGQAAS